MTELPGWIEPGQTATLIWYDGVQDRGGGAHTYQVAGPALDIGPAWPYFLLAPLEQSEFAARLYRGEVTLAELRCFLDHCILAEGWMSEALDLVFTRAEARLLPVLDAWRALPDRPLLPYRADLDAFLGDDLPLYVSSDAYGAAQRSPESFATAWVCAGCGEAEDAAVFFWTLARDRRVRVCFLIQNEGGRWTCYLHPFEFEKVPGCGAAPMSPKGEEAEPPNRSQPQGCGAAPMSPKGEEAEPPNRSHPHSSEMNK